MPVAARIALGTAVLLTPGLSGMVVYAVAASPADVAAQDDRSDRIQDQEDAIDATQDSEQARQAAGQAALPAQPQFNFRINAPLYFNSNAQEVGSGGSAALEGDPEIELGWTRGLTSLPLKLSGRLRADTDRYANVSQADEDETSGSFKASYYDANDDQAWSPFVSYKGTLVYDATFSPWTETRNDFAVGFEKRFNLDAGFDLLPASARSRAVAVWGLGFDVYVQRRLRTPGPDSNALYVVPSATYVPNKEWSISLFLNTRERWFDSATPPATTPSRRDFEVEPILTIAYDPSRILFGRLEQQKRLGSPQIALQVGFERRSSNLPHRSWDSWTVGPVLTANWRF